MSGVPLYVLQLDNQLWEGRPDAPYFLTKIASILDGYNDLPHRQHHHSIDSTWAMLYTWFLLGPKTREIWANRCGFTTGEADLPTIHAFVHFPIFTTPQQLDYLLYTAECYSNYAIVRLIVETMLQPIFWQWRSSYNKKTLGRCWATSLYLLLSINTLQYNAK